MTTGSGVDKENWRKRRIGGRYMCRSSEIGELNRAGPNTQVHTRGNIPRLVHMSPTLR